MTLSNFKKCPFYNFQIEQTFTTYQLIYVMNELGSGRKFTNARSLLSIGLLSPGSTVIQHTLWMTFYKEKGQLNPDLSGFYLEFYGTRHFP